MEQISKELGGAGELVFKTLCFITLSFSYYKPNMCDSNTLALLWHRGQLHQEEVPVTLLVAAVMTGVDRRKKPLKSKAKQMQLFRIWTMQKDLFRAINWDFT